MKCRAACDSHVPHIRTSDLMNTTASDLLDEHAVQQHDAGEVDQHGGHHQALCAEAELRDKVPVEERVHADGRHAHPEGAAAVALRVEGAHQHVAEEVHRGAHSVALRGRKQTQVSRWMQVSRSWMRSVEFRCGR
eukprot:2735990-Pyramimonas_sp.AAC.1